MRLSEMNTKEAARALCVMAAPVERIGKDEEVNAMLSELAKKKDGRTMLFAVSGMVGTLVPALLERHYDDTMLILSVLTGKSVEQMEEQTMRETICDAKGSIDGELLGFFTPSSGTAGGK